MATDKLKLTASMRKEILSWAMFTE